MPDRRSPAEALPHGKAEESPLRRSRPTREDIPSGALERVERGEPAARIERDRHPGPPAQSLGERKTVLEQRSRPVALEPEQGNDLPRERPGEVVVGHSEAGEVVLRKVDAPKREIA